VREKRKEKEMNEIIVNRLEQLLKERMEGLVITHHDAGILAQYLADNGVIAPPVRIGQRVYTLLDQEIWDGDDLIAEELVSEVGSRGFWISGCNPPQNDMGIFFGWDKIGKEVFLSHDEAEKALKKEKKENE
jgi:hypothetical protein